MSKRPMGTRTWSDTDIPWQMACMRAARRKKPSPSTLPPPSSRLNPSGPSPLSSPRLATERSPTRWSQISSWPAMASRATFVSKCSRDGARMPTCRIPIRLPTVSCYTATRWPMTPNFSSCWTATWWCAGSGRRDTSSPTLSPARPSTIFPPPSQMSTLLQLLQPPTPPRAPSPPCSKFSKTSAPRFSGCSTSCLRARSASGSCVSTLRCRLGLNKLSLWSAMLATRLCLIWLRERPRPSKMPPSSPLCYPGSRTRLQNRSTRLCGCMRRSVRNALRPSWSWPLHQDGRCTWERAPRRRRETSNLPL
ncbi:hypothetical protein VTN96DRAFT_1351 [Rasamsonia emersonii]